jgi:hypothetical protein
MIESAPGEGCVLSVWVPAPDAPRDAPKPPPAARPPEPRPPAQRKPAPDAEPSDSVPRAVPGFTWQ